MKQEETRLPSSFRSASPVKKVDAALWRLKKARGPRRHRTSLRPPPLSLEPRSRTPRLGPLAQVRHCRSGILVRKRVCTWKSACYLWHTHSFSSVPATIIVDMMPSHFQVEANVFFKEKVLSHTSLQKSTNNNSPRKPMPESTSGCCCLTSVLHVFVYRLNYVLTLLQSATSERALRNSNKK